MTQLAKCLISKTTKNYLYLLFIVILSFCNLGTYLKKELDIEPGRPEEARKYDSVSKPTQVIIPGQNPEANQLNEEITKLRKEISDQKELNSKLLERITEFTNNQNLLISDLRNTIQVFQNISSNILSTDDQRTFKDAFILNKDGRPFAFIDAGLKIYGYDNGNLLGWIKSETKELIRNYDNSIVGIIENDFVIDETGHAVGSIERSENLRWDREKLYSKIQKTPASHFFIMTDPKPSIISRFRFSDWSVQKIEDILTFDEKDVQKLK